MNFGCCKPVFGYFYSMFIRKNTNRSGSVSVQIVSKAHGRYKVVKSLGSGKTPEEIEVLYFRAKQELELIQGTIPIFTSMQDSIIEGFLGRSEANDNVFIRMKMVL